MSAPALENPKTPVRLNRWFSRYPVAAFLLSLITALVSSPFEERMPNGDLVETVRLTVVLIHRIARLERVPPQPGCGNRARRARLGRQMAQSLVARSNP